MALATCPREHRFVAGAPLAAASSVPENLSLRTAVSYTAGAGAVSRHHAAWRDQQQPVLQRKAPRPAPLQTPSAPSRRKTITSLPNRRGLSPVNGAVQEGSDAVITPAIPRSSHWLTNGFGPPIHQLPLSGDRHVGSWRDLLVRWELRSRSPVDSEIRKATSRNSPGSMIREGSAPPKAGGGGGISSAVRKAKRRVVPHGRHAPSQPATRSSPCCCSRCRRSKLPAPHAQGCRSMYRCASNDERAVTME